MRWTTCLTLAIRLICLKTVTAQSLSSLPECGQDCVENGFTLARSYGCSSPSDIVCLCKTANFGYGIRDCAAQSCPAGTNLNSITSYVTNLCNQALNSTASSTATSISGSVSQSRTSTSTSTSLLPSTPRSSASGSGSGTSPAATVTSSSLSGMIYTTITTTATATIPAISGNGLQTTTFTYISTVIDPAVYTSLIQHSASSTSTRPPTSSTTVINAAKNTPGLTTGAKAGIGIGITLGILAALAVAATIILRRRRRRNRTLALDRHEKQHVGANEYRVAELHQRNRTGHLTTMNELAGTRDPYELDAAQARYAELYGSHGAAEMRAMEDMTQVGTDTSYIHSGTGDGSEEKDIISERRSNSPLNTVFSV